MSRPALAPAALTYTVSIEDQPDGWDVIASSMDEAMDEAILDIWADDDEPVGTRFRVREYDAGVLVDCREGVVLA